ncbi:hypothetical protein C2845_PM08G16080 [Panicum miliaceum]|uniref:Response regulatory domain-containing protein n=1 Tax=Panicum miliaceum TaxID=4540 RepID=A0A3L6QWC3_PANMI|nr:hypothetical protein C2845_PM08G16080 [Panicum miliaceum]
METMIRTTKNGACDYLVKPAHIEQVRNIWMHVVRKNKTDPTNNINGGKKGANLTKNHSKKHKNVGDCAEEDKEETSTRRVKGSSGPVTYTTSLWEPSIRLAWTATA